MAQNRIFLVPGDSLWKEKSKAGSPCRLAPAQRFGQVPAGGGRNFIPAGFGHPGNFPGIRFQGPGIALFALVSLTLPITGHALIARSAEGGAGSGMPGKRDDP